MQQAGCLKAKSDERNMYNILFYLILHILSSILYHMNILRLRFGIRLSIRSGHLSHPGAWAKAGDAAESRPNSVAKQVKQSKTGQGADKH